MSIKLHKHRINGASRPPQQSEKRQPRSIFLAQVGGFLCITVGTGLLFGWTSPFEVTTILLVLSLWIFALSILNKRKTGRPRLADVSRLRFQSLLVGCGNGLIAGLLLYFLLVVVRATSTYQRIIDSDRPSFERSIYELRDAEEYVQAARSISLRLRGELSDDWKRELQRQHLALLTSAANSSGSSARARELWSTVERLGKEYGISVAVPDGNRTVYGRELPEGTKAEIIDVVSDNSGQSTLHVSVEKDDEFVPSLRKVDFQIRSDGADNVDFSLSEGEWVDQHPCDTVVLMDCSESTSNSRDAMEAAIGNWVDASTTSSMFRILPFSSTTQIATDWTNDKAAIQRGLAGVTWGGKSSLRPSVALAVRHLRQRQGRRTLLLLSDGHNNLGGNEVSTKDLVALCQQAEIKVFTVGVEHAHLKDRVLRYLARHTGGHYCRLSQASSLARNLTRAQSEHGRPVYLLKTSQPTSGVFRVQVGSGPHALQLMANADNLASSR